MHHVRARSRSTAPFAGPSGLGNRAHQRRTGTWPNTCLKHVTPRRVPGASPAKGGPHVVPPSRNDGEPGRQAGSVLLRIRRCRRVRHRRITRPRLRRGHRAHRESSGRRERENHRFDPAGGHGQGGQEDRGLSAAGSLTGWNHRSIRGAPHVARGARLFARAAEPRQCELQAQSMRAPNAAYGRPALRQAGR